MSYQEDFARSVADPSGFWREQAEAVDWHREPKRILLQSADGRATWFAGGQINTCYLALDHHVEAGRGSQTALVYDSPVTGQASRHTFAELRDAVAKFAGALAGLGVGKGDRVLLYMPMMPEAVIGMLATARLGAVHSVVFGGFAPKELAARIDDAQPKVILSASCGIEFDRVIPYKPLLDEALAIASHKAARCIIRQRPECAAALQAPRDLDWAEALAGAEAADCLPVAATDPLYILYTSGTTGRPKGVVRDHGGHAVALLYSMKAIYDVAPGEVFWAASDVGWVVGHSYIVYAPLLRGCATVLYEGKPVRTPDAGAFWRVIAEHRVNLLFAAPTAFRAIRKEDPKGELCRQYDLGSLKRLFVAGERTDPATYEWLLELLGLPVIDHWWQTETGWPIAASPMGLADLPRKPGSVSLPVPGFDVRILAADGKPAAPMEEGDVALKLPLPPGCLPTLWGDDARFQKAYLAEHPGHYHTGDGGYLDDEGYLYVMGRTDDVINVAGHRLSTGAMEESLAAHPAIAECAVIGVPDPDKGQAPVGLVVLKDGVEQEAGALKQELAERVRADIGAFANYKQTAILERLPKTRSGKILRQAMRQIADAKPGPAPATIDDPAILDEVAAAFKEGGIGALGAQ